MKFVHGIVVAIVLGILLGVGAYKVVRLNTPPEAPPRPPEQTPSSKPSPGRTTPPPTPEPTVEPEEAPPVEVDPSPTTPPAPQSRPAYRFPPPMPACMAGDTERLYEEAFSALDSGEVARTEALFEELAVCRGEYALAIGSLYDPALQLSGNLIEHDPRKALHFYIYAAALGKRAEVLQRLSALHELARSDSDLEREISILLEALGRPQR